MTLRLRRAGFAPTDIQYAVAILQRSSTALIDVVPLAISQIKEFPLISIIGFPAASSAREVKALVGCMPGYLAFASKTPYNILTVFVWWTCTDMAVSAKKHLAEVRLDQHCTAALVVGSPTYWHLEECPPNLVR